MKTLEKKDRDFYQALRRRIREWLEDKGKPAAYADYLLFAPDMVHLLSRLVLDRRVPLRQKARLGAALAYLASPVDLIGDIALGPVGMIDDVVVMAYVLNGLINAGHGAVAEELWAGDKALLEVVRGILDMADQIVGQRMWKRIRGILDPDDAR